MAVLQDISDIVNRLTGGNNGTPEHLPVWIDGRIGSAAAAAHVAGRWSSLWRYNKSPGANGAIPGAVEAPTRATLGALGQANPGGGRQKWLLGVETFCHVTGLAMLYDRLLHIGGLDGTVLTAQNVGGSLTRYHQAATCIGNQIWIEIYTQIGATGTTITTSYQNENNQTKTTPAVSIGGTNLREDNRILPMPLADGDRGVLAVNSVTLAGTTGTAGNFGVTVARPILIMPVSANSAFIRDCIAGLPSVPEILTDACLTWAFFSNTTVVPNLFAIHHFIEA